MTLRVDELEQRRAELSRCFAPGDPRREPSYWTSKVEAIAGREHGVPVRMEAFADRAGIPDGRKTRPGDALTATEDRALILFRAGHDEDAISAAMDTTPRVVAILRTRLRSKGYDL